MVISVNENFETNIITQKMIPPTPDASTVPPIKDGITFSYFFSYILFDTYLDNNNENTETTTIEKNIVFVT